MEIVTDRDELYTIRITYEELLDIHYSLCELYGAVTKTEPPNNRSDRLEEMIDKLEVLI